MKFDINFLKALGAATIAYGLIFFVAIRIFKNSNNMKRAVFSLILGGILILINLVGLVIDYIFTKFNEEYMATHSFLFAFPIMAVAFTVIMPLVFFLIGKKNNQSFNNDFKYYSKKILKQQTSYDKDAKQTIIDYTNYLYLTLKYEDKYLLKGEVNKNDQAEFSGLIMKFSKGQNFQDEFLKEVIESLSLDVKDVALSGKVIQRKNNAKANRYYVYTIELNSISEKISDLVEVSPLNLYEYTMNDFNKKILFRVILREYFEIEV